MKKVIYLFSLLFFISVILISSSSVFAQNDPTWSPQQRIPGYESDTLPPILIADENGTVHAFFSQWLHQSASQDVRVIMYDQWALGRGWTKPVDIFSSPLKTEAQLLDVLIDDAAEIHIIFWGGDNTNANLYYAHAPVTEARNAHAWSVPARIAENAQDPGNGVLYIDEQDNYSVLFAGKANGNGLYTTNSQDGGNTWSKPMLIYATQDSNNLINYLSISTIDPGSINAIWNEITEAGQGRAIYYGQKRAGDIRWGDPVMLAAAETGYGTNTPAIIEYHNTIYALYNLGGGIWQRTYDGKEGWSLPVQLFPGYVGVNGSLSFAVDGNNDLHLFFGQRIPGSPDIHGIWESKWLDNQWTYPVAVVSGPRVMSGNNDSFDPFDARAAVCQGNVILVTWRTDPGNGTENENGVWYSYIELNIPQTPGTEPAIKTVIPSTAESVTESTPALLFLTPGATETTPPIDAITGSNLSNNQSNSFLIVLVPSVFFVSVILLIYLYFHRRMSQ